MGWVVLMLLALLLAGCLWRFGGFTGAKLQFLGAAVLLACAGYVWQGRPGLPGQPKTRAEQERLPETPFAVLRGNFLEQFDYASRWLIIADGYQRRGKTEDAVGIIRAGLRQQPRNMALWTGLGNALVIHGGGTMNPAAELAYRRAAAVAPSHPAPRFFYGLSLIQSGQIAEGERIWRELLAGAPAGAKWRPLVEERLAIIDRLRAMGQMPPQ